MIAPPRVKLLFLDGMRGLAALYVLLFHAYAPEGLSATVRHGLSWLRFGHYAVGVFIVLSGYSLMIPVVRSVKSQIPGGAVGFFKRRAFRIMPPYYAALFLSIAVDFLLHCFGGGASLMVPGSAITQAGNQPSFPEVASSSLRFWDVITHIMLIHNWFPHWNLSINPTHWSVATEAQIYLLFPFLLLPVWGRFGNLAVIFVGVAVGVLPLLLFPSTQTVIWACPQFVGLFTFGMVGAAVSFSREPRLIRLRQAVPWGGAAAFLLCIFIAISKIWAQGIPFDGQIAIPQPWTMDLLIGTAAGCLIVSCTKYLTQDGLANRPIVLRVLESGFATQLGAFSYSIYLMHLPIIFGFRILFAWIDPYQPAPMIMMFLIGIPVTLLLCYLFHLAFEQRFMRNLSLPKKAPGEIFLATKE